MPLFILIAIYTGRRKEAILSLRWPQVNLEARTINFEVSGRRRTNKRRGDCSKSHDVYCPTSCALGGAVAS